MSKPVDSKRHLPSQTGAIDHSDEYFIELCAVATSGSLTPAEWNQLEAHLTICPSCRAIKADYERVLATHLPALASSVTDSESSPTPTSFSIEAAEAALIEKIEEEGIEPEEPSSLTETPAQTRRRSLVPVAAVILIGCTYAVWHTASTLSSTSTSHPTQRASNDSTPQVAARRSSAIVGASPVLDQHRAASQIADLEHRLTSSVVKQKALEGERQSLASELTEKNAELFVQEQRYADLEQKLSLAEAEARTMQVKLTEAVKQSAPQVSFEALQRKIDGLEAELHEQQQFIARQDELLGHDRDIRNLMGARDLYIGEIYDVAKSGKTRKPFGRVFYTQGKSLVFYAYDLDQQPGMKLASTFQAWGRRGVDEQHDVSLGIFYQDDQNKARWVLKSNDSITLAQLDAVFVTVEPQGESPKPTGKPFLFTYLRLPPNHP